MDRLEWTTTELLMLAHAVQKFGDNAWPHVSKIFTEPRNFDDGWKTRNPEQFTGRKCASKYAEIMEAQPKRKREGRMDRSGERILSSSMNSVDTTMGSIAEQFKRKKMEELRESIRSYDEVIQAALVEQDQIQTGARDAKLLERVAYYEEVWNKAAQKSPELPGSLVRPTAGPTLPPSLAVTPTPQPVPVTAVRLVAPRAYVATGAPAPVGPVSTPSPAQPAAPSPLPPSTPVAALSPAPTPKASALPTTQPPAVPTTILKIATPVSAPAAAPKAVPAPVALTAVRVAPVTPAPMPPGPPVVTPVSTPVVPQAPVPITALPSAVPTPIAAPVKTAPPPAPTPEPPRPPVQQAPPVPVPVVVKTEKAAVSSPAQDSLSLAPAVKTYVKKRGEVAGVKEEGRRAPRSSPRDSPVGERRALRGESNEPSSEAKEKKQKREVRNLQLRASDKVDANSKRLRRDRAVREAAATNSEESLPEEEGRRRSGRRRIKVEDAVEEGADEEKEKSEEEEGEEEAAPEAEEAEEAEKPVRRGRPGRPRKLPQAEASVSTPEPERREASRRRRKNEEASGSEGEEEAEQVPKRQRTKVDSENNESEKVSAKELSIFLQQSLKNLSASKLSRMFEEPVTPEEAPSYHDIIREPIDLSVIKKKVMRKGYVDLTEYRRDLLLMCANALVFNPPSSEFHNTALDFRRHLLKELDRLEELMDGDQPRRRTRLSS